MTNFPATAQASQAEAMLAAPQMVTGTLVTHSRLARVRPRPAQLQLQSGAGWDVPDQRAVLLHDGSTLPGDFSFRAVPVGGPYVLRGAFNGNWTTLINPATNQPANPVTVTALVPVDLTFVVLPS